MWMLDVEQDVQLLPGSAVGLAGVLHWVSFPLCHGCSPSPELDVVLDHLEVAQCELRPILKRGERQSAANGNSMSGETASYV